MKRGNGLNKDIILGYKGLLNNLSKEYIDKKIDINTLESKYRRLTNNVAEKHGITTNYPVTIEYFELDEYGKKEVEKFIGRSFPRPAIQRIIEEDRGTEPGLILDKPSFQSLSNEIRKKVGKI